MEYYLVLDNLFNKQNDEIHFELFKKSNIIEINNDNKGDYDKDIIFNTGTNANNLINYKNAYILLKIQVEIPNDETDEGKKSIPGLISLKKSYELVNYLMIKLNNVIVSNESDVNRSSLVNYVLNNSNKDYIDYRSIEKATSSANLNVTDNQFIIKDTYSDKDNLDTPHYIDFEIPIFLKDINNFFKNINLLKFAEFNITVKYIDNMIISQREGTKTTIKSCYLYVEKINLSDKDETKYLRMLNNGYIQNINFLENHTIIFNDKMSEINEKFNINNVQNGESIFIYGILNANKEGKHYDMPSVEFKKTLFKY